MLGGAAGLLGHPTSLPSPDFPWCPASWGCRDFSDVAPQATHTRAALRTNPADDQSRTAALRPVRSAGRLLIRHQKDLESGRGRVGPRGGRGDAWPAGVGSVALTARGGCGDPGVTCSGLRSLSPGQWPAPCAASR